MNVPKLVIDGYNLLFQSNLVGRGRGRNWLLQARARLLTRLDRELDDEQLKTTHIVFDAPKHGLAPQSEILPSGMWVSYAVDHAEADELIEEIISKHPTPKQLTVVSSDLRIRGRARARRAVSLGSQDFLDQLDRRHFHNAHALSPSETSPGLNSEQQPPELSDAEIEFWLKEFDTDSSIDDDLGS